MKQTFVAMFVCGAELKFLQLVEATDQLEALATVWEQQVNPEFKEDAEASSFAGELVYLSFRQRGDDRTNYGSVEISPVNLALRRYKKTSEHKSIRDALGFS